MAAGDDERDKGELDLRLAEDAHGVRLDVVDADHRLPRRKREPFDEAEAREHRADQARPLRHRQHIYIPKGDARLR